ncbi:MAG: SET domain-containing protein-lysine N-methyltransferase [Parvularculaceae bacterium]
MTFDLLLPAGVIDGADPAVREHLIRYAYPRGPDRSFVVYEIDNGRFMNHSDTPNTDFTSSDRGFANCDIAEGEELLGDYREFWPEYFLLPGRTHAGAPVYANGSDRAKARRG